MPIRRLPDYLINQLKAWEIVEGPFSVVKELVENSIDAGATSVTIRLDRGWKAMIRVLDNGKWIGYDDLLLVFERFATSKIATYDDLWTIQSFGFRGEALASIVDVATVSLTTKQQDSPCAYRCQMVGGSVIRDEASVGYEYGTDIVVSDLFATIPARQAFLKTEQTEWKRCRSLIRDIALINYSVAFSLWHNNVCMVTLPAADSLLLRAKALYPQYADSLMTHDVADGDYHWTCILSHPSVHISRPDMLTFGINNRCIDDKIIKKALMDGYQYNLPPKAWPVALIVWHIPPAEVDCNVHPRKTAVAFKDSQRVYRAVRGCVDAVLGSQKTAAVTNFFASWDDRLGSSPVSASRWSSFLDRPSIAQPSQDISQWLFSSGWANERHADSLPWGDDQTKEYSLTDSLRQSWFDGWCVIVGQLWDMYVMVYDTQYVYVIDHHALAERIAYEKMVRALEEAVTMPNPPCVMLLTPLTCVMPYHPLREQKIARLESWGFDITDLGGQDIMIYGLPQIFVDYPWDIQMVINELVAIDDNDIRTILHDRFAMKACKLSIKAGERLAKEQIAQLIDDGFAHIPWGFVCQHGRPFCHAIPKKNYDRLFGR